MSELDGFAAMILTHGRPHHVATYRTLRRLGYTGPIYLIVDNEDTCLEEYRTLYGEQVIVFDKAAAARTFDEGDNFGDRRAVIYARNACFEIARNLGLTYFVELDDDYLRFEYRFDAQSRALGGKLIWSLDRIFASVLTYYKSIPARAIAFMQTGDMVGGTSSTKLANITLYRKCMNSFFCSVDRPFQFVGRINEDVNTYVWYQSLGHLFLSLNNVVLQQEHTQSNPGGMTEMYLDSGTYVKSFYTVMYAPSCVRVGLMEGPNNTRLHHRINWPNAVPYILAASYRKADPREVTA